MNINGRVKKLEARVAEVARRPAAVEAAERRDAEFRAVLARWWAAIPPERRGAVADAIGAHVTARRANPGSQRPAILKWVDWCAFPHGAIFPDPIPVTLIDAYLNHPEACAGGFQCRACGVIVPTLPATGETGTCEFQNVRPALEVCPCCGGSVGWSAFRNRHDGRDTLPKLGAELLAGRDPISTGTSKS